MASTREICSLLLVIILSVNIVESRVMQPVTPASCDKPALPGICKKKSVPSKCLFDPSVGTLQVECKKTKKISDDCISLLALFKTESFCCPDNRVVVGTNNNRPVCCKLKPDICLTDCVKQNVFYSFKLGFDFQIPDGYALHGKYLYGNCSDDPTLFHVKLCKLTKKETKY
ncbi:uncharacterized protein LOC117336323 [Pecten maximus]|uniref:uncharacterized protein LOC117336323 n=1 Tax=Pecten maximus TaxID=6579 RepID=UPI0014589E74|nr:uncharacterized protein LOC117336323 [Pecten maximus]